MLFVSDERLRASVVVSRTVRFISHRVCRPTTDIVVARYQPRIRLHGFRKPVTPLTGHAPSSSCSCRNHACCAVDNLNGKSCKRQVNTVVRCARCTDHFAMVCFSVSCLTYVARCLYPCIVSVAVHRISLRHVYI
jgi:hypothetical protein